MKLSHILKNLKDVRVENFIDVEVSCVTPDSRKILPGGIFVAIRGKREDGSRYIHDAYLHGAVAFVLEKTSCRTHYNNVIISKNARKTLAEMCSLIAQNPQRELECIGITGTKGKTTTAAFLSGILSFENNKYISIGTNGAYGICTDTFPNTTPDPSVIFPLMKRAKELCARFAVLELSSQALADYRVFGINTPTAIFTGIGHDHIDRFEHNTFRDYLNAKKSLFSEHEVENAIVNADDEYSDYIAFGVKNIIKCGEKKNSDFCITEFKNKEGGCDFFLNSTKISLAMPGLFNAKNASYALVAASLLLNKCIKDFVGYISNIRVPGRYEHFFVGKVHVVVDYAHNEDSFRSVISLAKELYGRRIICVFGSVGERSISRRKALALVSERLADFSVITADDSGSEDVNKICNDIYLNFTDKRKAKIITDRESAIEYAISIACPGDCVLVLGKGAEPYRNLSGKILPYSDIYTVKSLV